VLLDDKTAVIYGAGGSIGGAVACAFAREGARVFLAGRTRGKLDAVPLAALPGLGIGDLFATDGRRDDALESLVSGP
jgi:NADP-dependent 3-hydroxy acid dehydrogenase YdfG